MPKLNQSFLTRSLALTALGFLSAATAATAQSTVVFDNMSNEENSVSGASITVTSSTPNTFMGDGYTLTPGTTDITGFDLFPVNLSGTSYTGLQATIYVWGTVNTGAVSAGSPAFSNLLGTYTFTETGTFTTGYFFPDEGSPVGSAPGYALSTPLTIPGTTIGVTFNYQGTTDGTTYSSINSLTPLISYGTLPTVGSDVFNGYYRNANSEVNGDFTSSLRSLGVADQSLGLRIYGDVTPAPEPTTLALAGAGALALLAYRRRA